MPSQKRGFVRQYCRAAVLGGRETRADKAGCLIAVSANVRQMRRGGSAGEGCAFCAKGALDSKCKNTRDDLPGLMNLLSSSGGDQVDARRWATTRNGR